MFLGWQLRTGQSCSWYFIKSDALWRVQIACAFVALLCAGVSAQPFQVGTGFGPTGKASAQLSPQILRRLRKNVSSFPGNLRSVDSGGPYNLTLLSVQQYETRGESKLTCRRLGLS